MKTGFGLVVIAACGRIGFDGHAVTGDGSIDASGDAPAAPCTKFGPFGAPVTYAQLSSSATDWGPHMSRDGLELVFASARGGAGDRLYVATRASVNDAWSAAVPSSELAAADDPDLSIDRLTMYWGAGGIHAAKRATVTAPWFEVGALVIPATGFSVDGGPWISRDGRRLLFTGTETSARWHQYETRLVGGVWGAATAVPLAHSDAGEAYGSYRGDLLEIIFETESSPGQLFHAFRTEQDDGFGPALPLAELNDGSSQFGDPDLSDDGTALWFASTRPGGAGDYDLWFTTRSCL